MAKDRCCAHCGQTLPEVRLGVKFTPLKSRIFDLIQRGGHDGITAMDLWDLVRGDMREGAARATLKSHVQQINELIEDSGYAIRGSGGTGSIYRLVSNEESAK